MKDDNKTKKQLVHELTELRSQDAALKKSITGSISAELAAEEARRYAESIVETVREPLLVLDADLKIISANRHFYRTFKVTSGETIGSFIYDLGNKQWDIPKLRELLETILPQKATFDNYEVEHDFTTIGRRIMLLNARQIQRVLGKERIILLAIEDITDRKQAEEKLRESEELFRSYLENAPDGVYLSDLEGNFLYGNLKCEEIIGYRREELIGKNFLELNILPEKSLNKAAQLLQANMEGKSTGPDEIELISKEGRIIPVEINTGVVQRMGQRIVLAFVRDITDRKRAEEALRESEEKYRWVLDNMADVITVMDMNLRFTYVSPSIMRMRGYTDEEATAQTFEQVMTPESLQISAKVFEEEMKLEASGTADPGRSRILELEQYRKDGSIVCMENSLSFMRDKAQKPVGIISASRDITDRKREEEKLQRTFESLRKAIGTTIQVMVSAVETRDPYTAGHQDKVARLAAAIAKKMDLSEEIIKGIQMAGVIHDIGKMYIPAEILSKPGKLSSIEMQLIRTHPQSGYDIMKDIEFPWPVARIILEHHERMDGSGYPRGLKGEEILIETRTLTVADVVEAMASHRPYRAGLGIDTALEEIEKNRGILYDEAVVDACLRVFRENGYRFAER